MNIETTANSLSRSNYFNLFVIFFDAMIVVIYDVKRSKYVMLVQKRKREMLEVPPSKERVLKRLWIILSLYWVFQCTIYLMESSSKIFSNIYPGLDNVVFKYLGKSGFWRLYHHCMVIVIEKSIVLSDARERVIFIVILLGILFLC